MRQRRKRPGETLTGGVYVMMVPPIQASVTEEDENSIRGVHRTLHAA